MRANSQRAGLFAGTDVVPPNTFILQPRDSVRINISGIGTLENALAEVWENLR
jgi:hypothetical protein